MLLYASEVWGTSRLANIETAHLFACKRLSVSDETPNHMVYGETGRYSLYIDSTISSLRYWFKLSKMPMTRFPKQALIMLKNSLDTNTTHTNRKRERESQDRDSETERQRQRDNVCVCVRACARVCVYMCVHT